MQTVYADVLVIVNIYINYILLRLSGTVARREAKSIRVFSASQIRQKPGSDIPAKAG